MKSVLLTAAVAFLAAGVMLVPLGLHAQESTNWWEWSWFEITCDVLSPLEARETWNAKWYTRQFTTSGPFTQWAHLYIQDPSAEITVVRPANVHYSLGNPIPPGYPPSSTLILVPAERTKEISIFALETIEKAKSSQDNWWVGYDVSPICRELKLVAKAPPGYRITEVHVPLEVSLDAVKLQDVAGRHVAQLEARDARGLMWLRIFFSNQAISTAPRITYEYEFSRYEQELELLSPGKSRMTVRVELKNNSPQPLSHVDMILQSPVASLNVVEASDGQGDIKFDYHRRPPIPPGDLSSPTLRFQLRKPIQRGETYPFTVVLDAAAEQDTGWAYTYCRTQSIYRDVHLEIVPPQGYMVDGVDPAFAYDHSAGSPTTGLRSATLKGSDTSELKLAAHIVEGQPAPPPPPTKAEDGRIPALLASNRTLLILVSACVGMVAVITTLWFFVLGPWMNRRKLMVAREVEEYERKLAQWEKEGYDVRKMRGKLKRSRKD